MIRLSPKHLSMLRKTCPSLFKAGYVKLGKILGHLRGFGLEMIGVGHCTGTRAFLALSNEFPNRVFLNTVGRVVSV